jgi:transposase
MAKRSRVELYEQIRKAHERESLSIHELARRFQTHRRYVRQALESAVPPSRKKPERKAPVLGPYHATIDGWLVADRTAPRKQRHTARRVWERLVEEQGARVAESTVRDYVRAAKRRLALDRVEVTIPQHHELGAEAEVDFGSISVYLDGLLTEVELFVMRMSASGKAFRHAYGNEAQEVFLDGHVQAFEVFGGVPGRIRYDNLKTAVVKVLQGRNRLESERFVALRSHYGFESFFCRPGLVGAHEKGGVEGEIGRFRRRRLVPVPRVASLAELNELLHAAVRADDARHIDGRFMTVAEHFSLEAPTLRALPEPFDVALDLKCRVDTKARVCVRQNFYSVPVRYAGRRLPVRLGAESLEVTDGACVVARHARSMGKKHETLVLDHYLEVLVRKPGALMNATALMTARASGSFTAVHQRFWDKARRRLGDSGGTRALIEVLLLHRSVPAAGVMAGMERALCAGSVDPAVVAIEARRAMDMTAAPVVPIGALVRFDRPLPTLDEYDGLLEAR